MRCLFLCLQQKFLRLAAVWHERESKSSARSNLSTRDGNKVRRREVSRPQVHSRLAATAVGSEAPLVPLQWLILPIKAVADAQASWQQECRGAGRAPRCTAMLGPCAPASAGQAGWTSGKQGGDSGGFPIFPEHRQGPPRRPVWKTDPGRLGLGSSMDPKGSR